MAVVGAAVAVLSDRAAELGHGQDDDVRHPVAEILREGGERPGELAQPGGELALLGTLADVGVPALSVGEGDLEPDIRLDELGDLAHCLAELAARVLGAVRRRDARGVGALEHLHRLESLVPRPREHVAHASGVERLEAAARGGVRCSHVEPVDRLHRDRSCVALERAGEGAAQRDGAERRRLRGERLHGAREPAVGRGLHSGRPRLHVVLGVEVRAGRVGRAAGVDDRERAILPVALAAFGWLERDRRAGGGVRRVAVWHDHAEPVHRAALEDGDEDLAPGVRRRRPDEEPWRTCQRHERARPGFQKNPSVHRVSPIAVGTPGTPGPARRVWRRRCSRGRGRQGSGA